MAPSPSTAKPVAFTLLNTRSVRNKSLMVKDHVVEYDIDILALTETWLCSGDLDDQVIRDVCPTGYEFYSVPRGSRGGGVGLLYKKMLKFKRQSIIKNKFKSFEFTDLIMNYSSTTLRIVIVYRPPSSNSTGVFFEEFSRMLEELVTASGSLLLVGDFNFHVNDKHDSTARQFIQLLEVFNLKQNITDPTHRNGHTLDLIITREDEDIARNFSVADPCISDHCAVSCTLSLTKTGYEKKEICYRKLKSIDMLQMHADIVNSPLMSLDCSVDVSTLVQQYHDVLSSLLDKHAPLKRRVIILRPAAPWYNDGIKEAKLERRRFERRWRATGLAVDRELYVSQCKIVNDLIHQSKMGYYSDLVEEHQSDHKKLFATVEKLLHLKGQRKLPSWNNATALADAFADYFTEKISKIRIGLDSRKGQLVDEFTENCASGTKLSEFRLVTVEELSNVISSTMVKSCALDPFPASVLKRNIEVLLPVITKIVNLSLEQAVMPEVLKEALLKPLLKRASLDHEQFSNHRPISNLTFISKTCERVVATQLIDHVIENDLMETFQSAYKIGHSTESALIRVQNDILQAIDQDECVILLLLDQSAAFDTVDHQILLARLTKRFGIEGKAYTWFKSYLTGRTQFVSIGNARSSSRPLDSGVPQGSVLGPILYLLYTAPLGDIMRQHGVSFHFYADDTQVYVTFKSSIAGDLDRARSKLEACVRDIDKWMLYNNLKLNDDKTEMLVFHAKHRPAPILNDIKVATSSVWLSKSARNIGVIFDTTLSLDKHIMQICKSSFYAIRNISRIRKYLSIDVAKIIVHAFVTSKLDNCNSLLYGIPKKLLQRLQYVLNSAARLVTLSRKSDHVTPLLMELHWLPIEQRIEFKVLLFTYKVMNATAPKYLCDLLEPYVPRRNLRSASKLMLEAPSFNLKSYGYRAFSVCAPKLWNSLPLHIKFSPSIELFKKNIKTYLFKKAFY